MRPVRLVSDPLSPCARVLVKHGVSAERNIAALPTALKLRA